MRWKVAFALCLLAMMIGGAVSPALSRDYSWDQNDPVTDEWSAFDLLAARPIGVLAGILGSAIFVATLPFTIPTGSVNEAARIFIVRPFTYSFTRPFPDPYM